MVLIDGLKRCGQCKPIGLGNPKGFKCGLSGRGLTLMHICNPLQNRKRIMMCYSPLIMGQIKRLMLQQKKATYEA